MTRSVSPVPRLSRVTDPRSARTFLGAPASLPAWISPAGCRRSQRSSRGSTGAISLRGILALAAAMLLLAVFGFQQMRQRATQQARLAATEQALTETAAEADRERARGEREQARLQQVNAQLADKARAASQRPPDRAPAAPAVSDGKKRFNDVHKDPEMKETNALIGKQAAK